MNLTDVSTAALVDELHRRRVDAIAGLPDINLPGVTIRPSRYEVDWQGRTVHLMPRQMDALHAIASAHPRGVTPRQLAIVLYENVDFPALNATRVYVSNLRLLLPGLLNAWTSRTAAAAYHLAGVEAL